VGLLLPVKLLTGLENLSPFIGMQDIAVEVCSRCNQ